MTPMKKSTTDGLSDGCFDWIDLLNRTRQLLETPGEPSVCDVIELTVPHFAQLGCLLQEYVHLLARPENASKDNRKSFVLDTRAALRVALCCSSLKNEQARDQVVTEAVVRKSWYKPLSQLILSHKGDPKTRVLASQLLSNLVTSNWKAAKIITSFLALSPTKKAVAERTRERITKTADETATDILAINWVDMMLACVQTNSRPALAGIVAAMHNALVSLQEPNPSITSSGDISTLFTFEEALTSDQMIINTLLRHIVPLQSVKDLIRNDNNSSEDTQDVSLGLGDSATEWISLLLSKCCKRGWLPTMFSSVSSRNERFITLSDIAVFPEHMVLLQCIHSQIDTPGENHEGPLLGGEAGSQGVVSTHLFLANLYCSLRRQAFPIELTPNSMQATSSPEWTMNEHALVTVLEMLASSLGKDGDLISLTRSQLGIHACTLIPDVGIHLGAVLDTLTLRNQGRSSRNFAILDDEEQLITALVRLIANVCFQCQQNQDLLRLTKVPPESSSGSLGSEMERNALHVLLSCTSLAHSCFTLREWAIIAIRNVLDDNEANQGEVAKLEANQPVQSAQLESLGIRVDMDSRGKVSVVPTDKIS
jgi:Spinocerebellar ataxia type 10 protein domain